MKRKFKIFDYTWHIPHQYDMIYALGDDCDFYYCLNVKRQWDINLRSKPDNLHFVSSYEFGKYDLAILHIDQQVIDPENIKRLIFTEFNSLITDIPKIIINHGTPVFPERFYALGERLSHQEMELRTIEIVKGLIGDSTMVVNSFTSASDREWGFGIPIVHGMNSSDWWDLPKEPRVFTALAPYGFDVYYNRKCMFEVSEILFKEYGYTLAYANLNIDTASCPEDYKNYLGRSLLYLDTSFRTPMNRARTEAFLSGCCVVQVEGAHDLERWAEDGQNIVLVPNDAKKISSILVSLLEEGYQRALAIGRGGKEMAKTEFCTDRYRADWLSLINRTVNNT